MDGHRYTALFEAPDGKPVLQAYPDPLTRGSPFTIGLGHTGKDVHQDTVWTEDQCWQAFYRDYSSAIAAAETFIGLSTWAILNDPRRSALTDMCFQMGAHGVSKFVKMLAAIRQHDWPLAKTELLDSDYARHQTPSRAEKNAHILLTGEWPA